MRVMGWGRRSTAPGVLAADDHLTVGASGTLDDFGGVCWGPGGLAVQGISDMAAGESSSDERRTLAWIGSSFTAAVSTNALGKLLLLLLLFLRRDAKANAGTEVGGDSARLHECSTG